MTNYIEWLVTSSGLYLERSLAFGEYTSLLHTLQNVDFKFSSMDRPRVDDAFDLRSIYVDNCIKLNDDGRVYANASVLEVLVALAIRVDMEITGEPGNPRPDILFVEWLKNLGILVKDEKWDIKKSNLVIKRLSKWMLREYNDDGKGSIFAPKCVTFGFSKTDIWRQIYQNYY